MILLRPLLLLASLVLLPLSAQAKPAKDWSRTVTMTAMGAYVIGNRAAATHLVEYVSYTCSHCAHFVAEATAPLKKGWVSNGRVSVEVRNLVRDRFDLTAALLARCGGAARFAGNHEAIFAMFPQWIEKVQAYDSAPSPLPADAGPVTIMTDIANKTGLIGLMAKRGITPAQSRACIADEKSRSVILALRQRGVEQDGITGTPGFLINGKRADVYEWAGLRPLLPVL